MTPEQQEYLKEAIQKANDNFKNLYNGMMAEAMDKTAFIEAVQPVHEEFCAKGETYKELYDDIQKYAE